MHLPLSTYRIQFNKDFTFEQLHNILNYLETLGVTTIYAAPILQAAPGSMHGYDVVDPHKVSADIGTVVELKLLAEMLKEKRMGWLQDIVPNHMAFDTGNERLMDVLERGSMSPFYNYFDVDWSHPSFENKIMVPVLGKELAQCVEAGEIKLSFSENGFTINYFDNAYPLSIPAYEEILKMTDADALKDTFDRWSLNASQLRDIARWHASRKKSIAEFLSYQEVLDQLVKKINGDHVVLNRLLEKLHYKLTFWKITTSEINYRRFFTVNSLICLRMEEEGVFNEYHAYLHELRKEGLVQGFRIDHIDGLYDPTQYIKRLRNLVGIDTYVVAEKILEEREGIPMHWEIEGTSGYEFLAYVSQLFTDRLGARKILGFYKTLVPGIPTYKELVLQNKKLILKEHMAGEWENLIRVFSDLGLLESFTRRKMKDAVGLLMLSLPVYRIYPDTLPLQGEDLKVFQTAFATAQGLESDCREELLYLESLFTNPSGPDYEEKILHFLRRLMQFTGPLTAKGVEDTTFYVYSPLISHDEVGDSPSRLGISVQEFHRKMIERQKHVPLALNATSTHDTKRGEDARIRLNVLSELPEEWINNVQHWLTVNQRFMKTVGIRVAPEVNEIYFIYQSLVGGFPPDTIVTDEFVERIQAYLTKVMREAKVNSNWEAPDEAYEKVCLDFVSGILHDEEFLKSFIPFVKKVTQQAGIYSLGQTLVKITAPGIPDIYQGTELWDLSFVDPDNRRPVDYASRNALLDKMKSFSDRQDVLKFVNERGNDAAAKLFVTWTALNFRKQHDRIFVNGDYLPVEVTDESSTLAFARKYERQWVLIIVPLSTMNNPSGQVVLPGDAPSKWVNVFTSDSLSSTNGLSLDKVFADFPVGLLYSI